MVDSYLEERDLTMSMHKKHIDSKATCFWKDCKKRIPPEQLFCSKSCSNKSMTWNQFSRMHKLALKYWNPDPTYMDARLLDGGLWYTRKDPSKYKRRHHADEWNANWSSMFSRYGIKKRVS